MAYTNKPFHSVQMYINGKSKPELNGERLIVLSWKGNTKTGREAHSARCVSVPSWEPKLDGEDKDFIPMLVDAFEQRQKKLAHEYVTMMLESNNGVCNDIPADLLAPSTVLEQFMNEDSEDGSRGKLSAEQIKLWFVEKLQPLVESKIAEKQGWDKLTPEQEKQVRQAANGYRATLERLAAPKPTVNIQTAQALLTAVGLLGDDKDAIAFKLEKKLDGIINPPADKVIALADLM